MLRLWADKHDTSPRPLTNLKLQEACLFPPAWMRIPTTVRLRSRESYYHTSLSATTKVKDIKLRKDTKLETKLTELGGK